MKKRVLITGINGFIGRSLRNYIKAAIKSCEIYGIDLQFAVKSRNNYACNLTRKAECVSVLKKVRPDVIFHLVGGRNVKNEKKLLELNLLTTKNLLDAVQSLGSQRVRVVVPGTAAEYGEVSLRNDLINETYKPKPVSWYGYVKLMQTNLALLYARAGLDVVVARMFNIAGAGTPPVLVAGKFVQDIVMIERGMKKNVIHTGGLDGKRDFLDIEDVCQALWLIAEQGKAGEIYNVCSGQSLKIKDMLDQLLALANAGNIMIRENKRLSSQSCSIVGSYEKLQKLTRWQPKVDIHKSLKQTLQYYRSLKTVDK